MTEPTHRDIDAALRSAFSGNPSPELETRFHARLRERLLTEERLVVEEKRQTISLRALVLKLYGSAAVVCSFVILRLIPWSEELLQGPLVVAFVVLAVALFVPSLLLRRLGWAELIVSASAIPGLRDERSSRP